MRKALTDFFTWHCDWCDSTHLVPNLLQHESRHFCPACGRHSAGMHFDHESACVYPV